MRKISGRIERWWMDANLMLGPIGTATLYGDVYGLEELGLEEGKFAHITNIWRIDFVERLAENEQCYIQLRRTTINRENPKGHE